MKRFLTVTEEAAFGVFNAAGTKTNIRLNTANAFRVMTTPEFWTVMSGSGFAVPALFGSQTSGLAATLTTPLDYSNAALLLGWACQRINTGQTTPWVTTELAGDLASCTLDYAWSYTDTGVMRTKRFLGGKVATLQLSGSKDSPVIMATLGIIAGTPQGNAWDSSADPTLSVPADSLFPTTPVLFQHAAGGLSVNNVARSNFQSLSFSVQNRIKAYFDESHFANLIRMNGRTTSLSGNSRLKHIPDDRTSFETAANLVSANSLTFTNAGATHAVVFTLNNQNYFGSVAEQFPLDEEIYYDWTINNVLDTAATTDFTFTVT